MQRQNGMQHFLTSVENNFLIFSIFLFSIFHSSWQGDGDVEKLVSNENASAGNNKRIKVIKTKIPFQVAGYG